MKKELENQIKLLSENSLNNNINKEIINLRNQVKDLLQYKNKCSKLEEKNFQLKIDLRKIIKKKQKKEVQ